MTVFIISTLVSLLSLAFSKIQASAYEAEYTDRLEQQKTTRGKKVTYGYGISPRVLRSWFDQALDASANFPGAMLLVIAYAQFPFMRSELGIAAMIVFVGAVTLMLATRSRPRYAGSFTPLGASWLTLLLILLNFVGIGLAFVKPTSA